MEAPVLVGVPDSETSLCTEIPDAATVTATDNCDNDVEVTIEEITEGEGCNVTVTRIWTATDNCGNATTASQQIQVADDSTPDIANVPMILTVECDDIPVPAEPTATDNCDADVEITLEEIRIDGECPESYVIRREWTATDDCGNQSTATQILTVQDTTAPTLEGVPEDVAAACSEVPDIPDAPTVTATDNCDDEVEVEK